MPTQVGEQNRFGYTWDGVQWQAPAAPSSGAATSGPPPPAPPPDYGYGNRYGTKTPKGLGFLGPLQRPDGSAVMSEYSIGTNIDGKETEIPSLVPTLSRDEVQAILTSKDGQPVARSAIEKAVAFARQRIAAGKDPFAQTGEQQSDLYPDLPRAATPPVRSPASDQGAATKVGEQNRFGYTWDGGRWQAPTAAPDTNTRHRFGDLMRESGPSFGQMELPPTVPGHVPPDYEGLRNALTMGGMLAGSALVPEVPAVAAISRFLPTLLRVAGASAGGATGRVAASGIAGVPEGSSVGGEAAHGAIEGGATEFLPVAAAPFLRGGGRLLRAVASAAESIPGVSRLQAGAMRALTTHLLGLGPGADIAAIAAPPIADRIGQVMDRTGTRMGGRTTTELVEDGLTALARRTGLLKGEVAASTAAPSTTPFHEQPLYAQMDTLVPPPTAPTHADVLDALRTEGRRRGVVPPEVGRPRSAVPPYQPPPPEPVPFNERPLYQQMSELPDPVASHAAPVRTRGAEPPYRPEPTAPEAVPFHERPLHQQMDELRPVASHAAPVRTRGAEPPYRPEAPAATPFNERPLYQQMEQLPADSGAAPVTTRGATPPYRPEPVPSHGVPFNEKPLYQQMDELLADTGPAPVTTRGAAPPYRPEPVASHAVANLEARTVPPASTEGADPVVEAARKRTTGRAAPPTRPTTGSWADAARERGVPVDPELQAVVDELAKPAAAPPPTASRSPRARDARGRFPRRTPPTE